MLDLAASPNPQAELVLILQNLYTTESLGIPRFKGQ